MAEVKVINPTVSTETNKLKVCAYARVSSDSADQLNSFIAQVNYYTELISNNEEWEFVDIYADEGLTGLRSDKREEFQRMLKDCRKRKIDRILTKSISRFSRNTRECIEIIRELKALGIEIEFEKEQINTGKVASELIVGLSSSMAQEESISISNNMRWSYQKRMQSGTFITQSAPYGYRLENGDLIIDEYETQIIRRIFNNYLMGQGITEIANELSADNIRKRDGSTNWHHTAIVYILCNEKYVGDSLLQKTCTTEILPFRKIRNEGQKDRYYVENSHSGIISRTEFEQVRRLLDNRNSTHYSSNKQQYPLSKKIECGECGKSFKRKPRSDSKVYWVCYNHNKNKELCSIKQVLEAEIYEAFIRLYNKLRKNYKYILVPHLDQLMALKSSCDMNNVKIVEINKEIAELTEQNLILNRLRSKGYMDSAIFIEQTNEINNKISNLRTVKKMAMENDEDDKLILDTKNLINIIENSHPLIETFDEVLFQSIINKVIVESNDKLRFRILNGLELTESIQGSKR